MGQKAKSARKRISLLEFTQTFNSEEKAMCFFEAVRWREGRCCPHCGSAETSEATHKTMPYWCPSCRKYFSVRTGTLMQESRIPYLKWLTAIYLIRTSLKGISSTKLGNDLGISQQSAWFLGHRIREGWKANAPEMLVDVLEVDEAYLGGKEKNKHKHKKLNKGRGTVGKEAVVGIKERKGKKVRVMRVENTDAQTLHWVILGNAAKGSTVYTDDHAGYSGIEEHGFKHETVHHSIGEYVKGEAHTNGVESFWALLKRGYYGTYHKMSPKHLQKYLDEFADRTNVRQMDTLEQIKAAVAGLVGKRLTYKELTS